jgi:CMP-N,N'-diacetyllegionaminic acid synthase
MNYLAIIPARGGSKGVPGKNTRAIAGRPLIAWSILQARAVGSRVRVVVSTDSPEIADVARDHGAEVPFVRPAELAQDTTPTEPVMLHAMNWYAANGYEFGAVLLLQPTSPLRLPGTIAAAISEFESSRATSLLGVCENHHFYWRNKASPTALYDFKNRPRRQDIRPVDRLYRENGSIYITQATAFREHRNRLCGQVMMHVMREEEGWEIDSLADFAVVEALMQAFLKHDR